ncbi:hypothetical protein [Alteromonas sp. C1M14]|uniref:hypothetical protein n=1 Tax=Alteromonas sp. C1M14 TaxID=2841567 RepID=UPI001C092D93|nr:hypothetical protein [Alteromonas sp. C1M14]MBU2978773.1 hypothetical protein [Alteromonas sp. C1M14]
MNNLKFAVVLVFLIVLSSLSREISNPAPTDIELSYQRQYQELNQKGYLTETDIKHLDELKARYLHSNERADKMQKSIGYKFLWGIVLAAASFWGLKFAGANIARVAVLTSAVALTSLTATAVFEASIYTILTLIGAVLALKHNKQIHPTPNSGAAD